MDLLIKNIGVVIRDADRLEKGMDIRISGNKIEKIGADLDIPGDCRVIDASEKVVMPGLINAHTHRYQSFLRGVRDDLQLKAWCESVLFPFAGLVHRYHWNEGDISAGYFWSAIGTMEMIHSGVTCCINMDLTLDSVFEAWQDIGFRGIGAITAVNRWIPKEFIRDLDDRKAEIEGYIEKWHTNPDEGGLIKVFIAPSTCFTCTADFLGWLVDKAEQYDLGMQTHISETKWEVEQSLKEFNATPLDYLERLNFLRRQVSAAHCVHLTEEEIDLFVTKAALSDLELIRMFKPASPYKNSTRDYCASDEWQPYPKAERFVKEVKTYKLGKKPRKLVFMGLNKN